MPDDNEEGVRKVLGTMMLLSGAGCLIAGMGLHLINPELTQAEALIELWPYWVGAVGLMFGGLYVLPDE